MLGNIDPLWLVILIGGGGYILGSVPFGVVVARCLGATDPRTAGSRNVGFTNVLRVSGAQAGILTLVGDMGKGWLVGWVASRLLAHEELVLLVAAMPIFGHMFSIFLKFQGGKGVATALGSLVGVDPIIGLSVITIWLVTVALSRYSSGGALAAFTLAPLVAWGFGKTGLFLAFTFFLAILIWWKHTENIIRLWNGTERRIGHSS